MKHLLIRYGDVVLYDGVPGKVSWSETGGGIKVEASTGQSPAGGGFFEQLQEKLQAESRRQTEEKRAQLIAAQNDEKGAGS